MRNDEGLSESVWDGNGAKKEKEKRKKEFTKDQQGFITE